jgi:hypothetical protein
LKACGGYRDFGLFNCFQQFCCGGKAGCDEVCPNNEDFIERVSGINGLRFDDVGQINQRPVDLPVYVPHLNHRYGRKCPLDWPLVAITPYELFRLRKGVYKAEANSPADLRTHFNLSPDTRIVLRGTDKDKPLEKYWERRVEDLAPEQLARLGIDLVIGPNFSHFSDVPRTDNIYNRKRQIRCLEELQAAGLNVAPHLSDAAEGDWDFWRGYLTDNPSLKYVAKEFQTGNKPLELALKVLAELEGIQQHVGRPIHPIMIGGAQLTEHAASRFETFTVLDSRPFMSAIKRRAFRSRGRRATWHSDQTLPGFGIDDILLDNLERYSLWLSIRAKSKSSLKHLRHRRAG